MKYKVNLAGSSILVYTTKDNLAKVNSLLQKYNISVFKIVGNGSYSLVKADSYTLAGAPDDAKEYISPYSGENG